MKNSKNETAVERMERMKREKAASRMATSGSTNELVSQLTHEGTGDPDFTEIARKLEERKSREAKGENFNHVKMTMYIRKDIYDAFNALITKRGQQKEFTNQALSDFVQKKMRELDLK